MQMIDPLPQPHRKAHQRGISSETIEKIRESKEPVTSTSKTSSLALIKPSTSKDQWLSKSVKKKSSKEIERERKEKEDQDRKAKRKAKLEELAKNQQEKKSDDTGKFFSEIKVSLVILTTFEFTAQN